MFCLVYVGVVLLVVSGSVVISSMDLGAGVVAIVYLSMRR